MNKYSSLIQDILSHHPDDLSVVAFNGAFCKLDDTYKLAFDWNDSIVTQLTNADSIKLSWLYLLSIVDQATADEMIQMMCEPYSPSL